MLNQILQNTRKPQGFWGEVMLFGMNNGHKRLSDWAMPHLPLSEDAYVLDVGCGGGANFAGLDHSAESVAASQKKNEKDLGLFWQIFGHAVPDEGL